MGPVPKERPVLLQVSWDKVDAEQPQRNAGFLFEPICNAPICGSEPGDPTNGIA